MTLSKARFIFLWPFYLQVLLVNFVLRLVLSLQDGGLWWSDFPEILFWGAVHDTYFFTFFAIPIVIYLWLTPARAFIHPSNKGTMQFISILSSWILVGIAFFEYGFWQTHQARFDETIAQLFINDRHFFITVLRGENLWALIPSVFILGIIIWGLSYKLLNYYLKRQEMVYSNFRFRVLPAAFFLLLPCLIFYFCEYKSQSLMPVETHWNKDQLKRNGSYQMMSLIYQKKLYIK